MSTNHPASPTESRYATVSRRAFLRRAAKTAGALAVLPLISACSNDADVFPATTVLAAATTTTLPQTASSGAPPTTAATTTATVPEPGTVGGSLGEVLISFTYAASGSGGRVRNPYIAVWIEDEQGDLVDTVALWFLQSQKGLRWLTDLRRWYDVDGSEQAIDTISSATRRPGDYTLSWDMTNMDGEPVAAGEYYVCIESAREHGPYSLIRAAVSFDTAMGTVALPDDGELSNATVGA